MVEQRVRVSVTLPKEMVEEFKRRKEEISISVSKQIEFKLKGYSIERSGG